MTLAIENGGGGKTTQWQKVMVVAEPTRESAAALHYVLSRVVFDNDILYLLHVENPTFWKNGISCFKKQSSSTDITTEEGVGYHGVVGYHGAVGYHGGVVSSCIGGNVDFLDQMKSACEVVHPRLKVKVSRVETDDAKDKAYVILSETKVHGIDLLVVGKRQSLANAILRQRINGPIRETAEYLIENSKCTCVAVQRKGLTGGYLLHTKNHRNFWLLA